MRCPVRLPKHERPLFVIRTAPGGDIRLGLLAEVVHSSQGVPMAGLGVRWLEARSEVGPEPIQSFLEKVLGITKSQIRKTAGPSGKTLWVFSFPDLMTRSMEDDSAGLADLLEPRQPADVAAEAEAVREMAARDPSSRPGFVKRLSQIMRKVTSPGLPVVPKAREMDAPRGKVLPLPLLVKTQSRKLRGQMSKLSRTTIGITGALVTPKPYERVTVTVPIPEKRRTVEVVITGSVTRVKEDGTFTVRFLKVDEQGHKGIFQDYLDYVLGKGDGEED